MEYLDLYASYPDHTVASTWDSQATGADKTPLLADASAVCQSELQARFAACYAELRALPRSARRDLQRRIARSSELAARLPGHLQKGGRRLQHKMAWTLAGAALLLALGQGVATAATITVTTSNPKIARDGQCSLIEAIINANNNARTHADCRAGSGADTIVMPANANVTLSNVFTYTGGYCCPIGLPQITSRITIEGNGATIAGQGNATGFGLIYVTNSGDLTLESVTLSGASGGYYYRSGGAIANDGTVTIRDATISGNSSNYWAGGIANLGILTIENSTIFGNIGNRGGGMTNFGTATIENTTISGNTAESSDDGGGGVFNLLGNITIANSTISGDTAITGGGVLNRIGFTGSSGPINVSLKNTVIAGNLATAAPELSNGNGGVINANNFNLIGSNGIAGVSGFVPGPTDIVPNVPVAQILGPLQNNGGATQTHALVAGSPAIDAGDPNGCRDTRTVLLVADQRGFRRSDDGNHDGTSRCDIGAYELTNILAVSDSTFVRQQYLDFLDRDPEAAGLAGWVNALDDGLPRASLIEALMDSEEFLSRGKFIAQTYLGLLTRDADFSGYRAWLEVLLAGVSHEQIVQWFLESDEFTIRFGSSLTNSQFIDRLYNNVLLRSADPVELNLWLGQLTSGQMTRAQAALAFLDSDEFQNLNASQNEIDVSLLYFCMLRRDPDPAGFAGWVGVLNSGVPLYWVIDAFLHSPEYQAGF